MLTKLFSRVVNDSFADGSVAEYAKLPKVVFNLAICAESLTVVSITVAAICLAGTLASFSF